MTTVDGLSSPTAWQVSTTLSFLLWYIDTVSNTQQQKDALWASLDSALSRVSSSDYIFLLRDANARTGRRIGEKGCKIIGAYGRNARPSDSNETSLLRFASDNKLAHIKHVLFRPEGIHVSYIQWYLAHG